MTNKPMLSVEPLKGRLIEIMQHLTFAVDRNAIREAIALLDVPAAQQQGEPVAWVIGTANGSEADYYPGKGLDTLEIGAKLYAEQPAQVAVVMTRKIGNYGKAYDLPEAKRAYTYKDQPGNMEATKLGRAVSLALPGGDSIDHGLSLLKALSDEGFGVFELDRPNGVKP